MHESAEPRSAVVAAALELFQAQGYDQTSVEQIARAAGVSRSTFFRQFGGKDDVVPPSQSRRMDAALKAAGARDARYTEFPDANHNSWDATYAHAPMWDWLFAQRRGR